MEKVSSVDLNHHFLHGKQVLFFSGLILIPIEVADVYVTGQFVIIIE